MGVMFIGSSSAFFGQDTDSQSNYNGTYDMYHAGDMQGNFSMSINASGKMNSKMQSDFDTNSKVDYIYNGYRYRYYPYPN